MGDGSSGQQNKEAGAKSAPTGVKANNKPVVVLTQSGLIADGNGQWKANLMTEAQWWDSVSNKSQQKKCDVFRSGLFGEGDKIESSQKFGLLFRQR